MSIFKDKSTGGLVCLSLGVVLIVLILGGLFCWSWQMNWLIPACKTENLKLDPGQQSGAAGTIYQHMALTNTGKEKCTLAGYPMAFLFGSDGYALGNSAAARPQPAPVSVTLAPGETAHTVLGYPQAGNFSPGVCTAKSVNLRLYPPSATSPLETPLEIAWCPGFSETAIESGN
jgi:Protein of unknown function (DUF4232)